MNKKPNTQDSPITPYVGLMPFTEKDADFFFGRKDDIEVVATNLRAACLTVFYGASGVGKSSLLNAGVVPYLQKIATSSILPGEPPEFILVVLREWANNPLESLRLRIKEAVKKAVEDNKIPHLTMPKVESTATANKENSDMSLLLKSWTDLTQTNLLIIFDQFEDLFLHPEFTAGSGSFGEEFPKAVNNKDLPVNFIISLRDDALAKLDFFKGTIPNLMKNTLRLLHLDREATEEAIRKPLDKYNEEMGTSFTIEGKLVEKLLDDLQVDMVKLDTQGQAAVNQVEAVTSESPTLNKSYKIETPYLQLVMMRLWKDDNTQREQRLALETLIGEDKLGGVQKIVETHLDDVMNQFDDADKELASEFIHFTVTRSGTKIPSDINDLAEWAELPDNRKPNMERILRQLSTGETRIFKSVQDRRNKNKFFYEVAHDALGPAILSWRKREHDAILQKKASQEEEQKRQKELVETKATRQAELEKERQEKEEQATKLEQEKEKRQFQEKLLAEERRNRKLGRRVWYLLALLTTVVIVVVGLLGWWNLDELSGGYFKKFKDEYIQEYTINKSSVVLAEKLNQSDEDIKQKTTKYYEERISDYKSLIEILADLQSGKPEKVAKALELLDKKAENNEIPEEYKSLIVGILENKTVAPQETSKKEKTITAVKNSQTKTEKPKPEAPTIIFIQIQKDDSNAKSLQTLLKNSGYLAPGIENVGEQPAVKRTQLRYFRDGDSELATKICAFLIKNNIDAEPKLIEGYENSPLIRQNQFELWFTSDPIPNINSDNISNSAK